MAHKESGITATGTNYLRNVVLDFLSRSFDIYKKTDFSRRRFQVSTNENTYATAGIVLAVIGLEAYRNILYFIEKKEPGRIAEKDICKIIGSKNSQFPSDYLNNSLHEVFILRDIIVHSHVYDVELNFDDDHNIISQENKLVMGYGDRKFTNFTSSNTKRTIELEFNVLPIKIGFEDLYQLLIFTDSFISIVENFWDGRILQYRPLYKFQDTVIKNMSGFLAYYYESIPNGKFMRRLKRICQKLYVNFGNYLDNDCFLKNRCSKCGDFGFRKFDEINVCKNCGFGK